LDPAKMVPPPDPSKKCKMAATKTKGNTMSWKMECAGEPPTVNEGKMTYAGDTYTGEMSIAPQSGEGLKMTMAYSGRRIGDCK
jgi:hypothetical protein